MSWERDPLLAKARLFFERAFGEPRDDPAFGLWCSLGLELLARAALASISPTLLAEPDPDQRHLLHALGRSSAKTVPKSIGAAQVVKLCGDLFPGFKEEHRNVARALFNRRNEELHSGSDAFAEYPSAHWLAGFYGACQALAGELGENLETLFGEGEAENAASILQENQNDVKQRVESSIAAHRKVFEEKPPAEREAAQQSANDLGEELSRQRHHRVNCPACKSVATVQGKPLGKEQVTNEGDEIIVRQAVSPESFSCPACGLKFKSYAELASAGLGGRYTRTATYSPSDYFGLVDPDEYLDELSSQQEYDNED